ncbi:MAG: response regulator [Pseudomonadota bacterium]
MPEHAPASAELKILLVDDDEQIRRLIADYLSRHGMTVTAVADGDGMRTAVKRHPFDLVLLDIMLPGTDGLTLCRELREYNQIPTILLTALAEESDRVLGLEMGADDYVVKPFGSRELLARIRAVLRRSGERLPVHRHQQDERYGFDGWSLTPSRRELTDPRGVLVSLTAGEFDLLLALVRHAGKVLDRDQLLELTRGRRANAYDRAVDVLLSRLRKKLSPNDWIRTIRGGGYLFSARVERHDVA